MRNWTPSDIWPAVLAVASAIVLLANAAEKISKAIQAVRSPGLQQDNRIAELEEWRKGVDAKLDNDKKRLDVIDDGNRVTQRALLALLAHGIDGNNTAQMEKAKADLEEHLINR